MKTKRIIKTERTNSQVKSFKSDYRHGYNSLGDKWGNIKNNTLLGYKLLTLCYFSPSAVHDHFVGTAITVDKRPDSDLVLTVNGVSKTLDSFYWSREVHNTDNTTGYVWVYNDGAMNHDFFGLMDLYKDTIIHISLSRNTGANAVLWDDNAVWSDSDVWTEEVETIEARWDDNAIWSDSDVWTETVTSPAYKQEMYEWAKLAEKLRETKV